MSNTDTEQTKKGLLGANYADDRDSKKQLGFRFRVRGEAVAWAVRNFLKKDASSGLELLDMGAAEAKTLRYIDTLLTLKSGIGIEFNPELIKKAETLAPHLALQQGDITNLPTFKENSVDVISAMAVLEHLPDPRLAVAEAGRILKPGGVFVSSCPVPFWDHLSVKLGLLAEDHHECDMHASFFTSLFAPPATLELVCFKKFMWAPIGFLPYLGIGVHPRKALQWDIAIEKLKLTNFLFVNQLVVAVKRIR